MGRLGDGGRGQQGQGLLAGPPGAGVVDREGLAVGVGIGLAYDSSRWRPAGWRMMDVPSPFGWASWARPEAAGVSLAQASSSPISVASRIVDVGADVRTQGSDAPASDPSEVGPQLAAPWIEERALDQVCLR